MIDPSSKEEYRLAWSIEDLDGNLKKGRSRVSFGDKAPKKSISAFLISGTGVLQS